MLMQCILATQDLPETRERLIAFARSRATQLASTDGADSDTAVCYRAIEALFEIWPDLLAAQIDVDMCDRILACMEWNPKTLPINTCIGILASVCTPNATDFNEQ